MLFVSGRRLWSPHGGLSGRFGDVLDRPEAVFGRLRVFRAPAEGRRRAPKRTPRTSSDSVAWTRRPEGLPGAHLGSSWERLGPSGGPLGLSWGRLAVLSGCPVSVWAASYLGLSEA